MLYFSVGLGSTFLSLFQGSFSGFGFLEAILSHIACFPFQVLACYNVLEFICFLVGLVARKIASVNTYISKDVSLFLSPFFLFWCLK